MSHPWQYVCDICSRLSSIPFSCAFLTSGTSLILFLIMAGSSASGNNPEELTRFAQVLASVDFDHLLQSALGLRYSSNQGTEITITNNLELELLLTSCTAVDPPIFGTYNIIAPLHFFDRLQWTVKSLLKVVKGMLWGSPLFAL